MDIYQQRVLYDLKWTSRLTALLTYALWFTFSFIDECGALWQ